MNLSFAKLTKWLNPHIEQRLLRNISYLGVANVIYAAARWGLIVVAAKLGGIVVTSQLALGLAVSVPIMMLSGAGLRVVAGVDINRRHSYGAYLTTRASLNLLGLAVVIGFAIFSGYSRDTIMVIVLIGAAKFIEGLQEICWGISQRNERMDTIGVSKILRETGMIACMIIGLALFHSLKLAILFWIICWIAVFLFYDLPKTQKIEKLKFSASWRTGYEIALHAAPLAIVWGAIAFNERTGQYMLSWLLNEEAVGYYAPLLYVTQAGSLALSAVGEAIIPRLAAYAKTNRSKYQRGGLRLAAFGAVIGLAMLAAVTLIGRPLLGLLYQPDYMIYYPVFVVVMVAGIARYTFDGLGKTVTAAGVFWAQIPVIAFQFAVTAIGGMMLIPGHGLMGAAVSMGVGQVAALVLMFAIFLQTSRKCPVQVITP
jgi:O-antigen/teichoic acid export membrane protein